MSLFIDSRTGSKEFAPHFSSFSIEAIVDTFPFGDFWFAGNGPQGPVSVGIERKELGDLLTCLNDERYAGKQLPGLIETYDYNILLIEGSYKPDKEGFLTKLVQRGDKGWAQWQRVYQGKSVMFASFAGRLNTLRYKLGSRFHIVNTQDKDDTTFTIAYLYKWWNNKQWDEHTSHIATYDPASLLRLSSSFERRVAMQIEGVGATKSSMVEHSFPSVQAMANATVKQWMELDGIGKLGAERIVRQFQGKKK